MIIKATNKSRKTKSADFLFFFMILLPAIMPQSWPLQSQKIFVAFRLKKSPKGSVLEAESSL
jgi:hypothetical protein